MASSWKDCSVLAVIRGYLDRHRPVRAPLPPAPPAVRDVTGWLTRHPDSLTDD